MIIGKILKLLIRLKKKLPIVLCFWLHEHFRIFLVFPPKQSLYDYKGQAVFSLSCIFQSHTSLLSGYVVKTGMIVLLMHDQGRNVLVWALGHRQGILKTYFFIS